MSKADELLREYFRALDASADPTIVGSTCTLIRAESACRDYLNEKPHEQVLENFEQLHQQSSGNSGEVAALIERLRRAHESAGFGHVHSALLYQAADELARQADLIQALTKAGERMQRERDARLSAPAPDKETK